MTSSSILIDFHISQAFGSSRKEIEAYTGIRYALRCGATSSAQHLAAVAELRLMPQWARTAALPDLCSRVRKGTNAVVDAAHECVFAAILEQCEITTRTALANVLGEFYSGSVPGVLVHIRALCGLLANKRRADDLDRTHFSLERNEEIALALAILEVLATENPDEMANLLVPGAATDVFGSNPMDLIDQCLKLAFGRFQLLQAVDICLAMGDLRRADEALVLVAVAPGQEPDVLHRFAHLAFLTSSSTNNGDVVAWALEELSTFNCLRGFLGERFDNSARYEKLGTAAYWQDAVLRTAMKGPLDKVASAIGALLKPRLFKVPRSVVFAHAPRGGNSVALGELYADLLREAGETIDQVKFASVGLQFSYAIAPWFYPDPKRMRYVKPPWLPQDGGLYIRIISWSAIVCELMNATGDVSEKDTSPRYLGSFLLHAYHWLDTLERSRNNLDRRISEHVADLAYAGRQLIESITVGRYENPRPAFFVNLATDVAENGFFIGTDLHDLEFENNERRQDSIDRQFESVLVLLQRAVTVTEDEYRVGRWLEDIGLISDAAILWFSGRPRKNHRALYIAKCLKRFIQIAFVPAGVSGEDPLEAVRQTGRWTLNQHRALLLRDTGRFVDWQCGEPQIPVNPSFGYAPSLTVSLQRVAAAESDPNTPPEVKKGWLNDLRRLLSLATSTQDFDRFLQFRFVEILRSRAFADEPELAALIVARLIEFGSNHTFKMLAEWLLSTPIVTDVAANLRVQVFESVSRYVAALETIPTNSDEPRSPESRSRHLARANVLQRLVACCLISPGAEADGVNTALLIAAREKRDARIVGPEDDIGLDIEVDIEADGFVLPISDRPEADLRTATLVAFDATQALLRRIGPPPRSSDGINLFAGAFPDIRTRCSYAGIVVVAGQTQTSVALRPGEIISVRNNAALAVQPGQLISVSCGPSRRGRFDPNEIGAVAPITRRLRVEGWQVIVEPSNTSVGMEFRIAPPSKVTSWRWTEQTPNFLAVFAWQKGLANSYPVRATIDHLTQQAVLAIGRFSDLLLDGAEELATSPGFVLCIRSVARSERGDLTHLEVETWPLRCYRLDARFDFTREARAALEEELARIGTYPSPAGLLLVAGLAITDEGPRITLVQPQTQFHPHWAREPILGPFDDRNLRWRAIFEASADDASEEDELSIPIFARQGASSNVYTAELPKRLHVHGFPETVNLEFGSLMRRAPIVPAVIDRDRDGRPYHALFHVEEVSTNAIEELNPVELNELVGWLLDGGQDRLFDIRSFARSVSRVGLVRAFTKENLPVQLFAESVSLAPLSIALASDAWERRKAFGRAHFRRSELPPKFDVAQVPSLAFEDESARGILTSIPVTRDGEIALCRVAWRVPGGVDQKPLKIENLHQVTRGRLELGSRVSVDRRTIPPTLKLEQPSIVAEALWEQVDASTVSLKQYVGTAEVDGLGSRDLFELSPGKIVLQAADSEGNAFHTRFVEHHLSERMLFALTKNPMRSEHFRRDPSWRLALAVNRPGSDREEAYLCGLCAVERSGQGRMRLTGYEILVDTKLGPQLMRIRRRLRVRPEEEMSPVQIVRFPQQSEPVDYARSRQLERGLLLAEWLSVAHVEGRHDHQSNCFIPRQPKAQRLLPQGVAIAPDSFSRRSPHGPTEAYSRHPARLILLDTDQLVGSYAGVPPAGIEDLISALGSPEENTIVDVDDLPLSYVGLEREADGKVKHLFEWGYGWWAKIDACSVQYKGGPVDDVDLWLAFGDWITSIRLIRNNDHLILSIEETKLSAGHILYKQAKDHRILHVLHVSSSHEGDVRVERVEGYDSTQARAIIRHFPRLGALLEANTAREVRNLILDRLGGTKARETIVLYGRMLVEQFKDSGGAEIVYRGVQIGAETRVGFEGLCVGDRIFVRAKTRIDLSNDTALSVEPLPAIAKELVDPAAFVSREFGEQRQEWWIFRRTFSYDEDALARITSGNYNELENRILLVRLTRIVKGRLEFSHSNGAPPRAPEVLDGLLAQAGGSLFCVFADRILGADRSAIRLELRPGALIDIDDDRFEGPDDDLEVGDILRIERHETNGVTVHRAIFALLSDRRYARSPRPVVVLPTNPLARTLVPPFEKPSDLWEALASFTVGDFRQVRAMLVQGVDSSFRQRVQALERFLITPHPKLAWLSIDSKAGAKGALSPDDQRRILAGRLELVPADEGPPQAPRVRAVPLENGSPELAKLSIDWSEVTFSDGSAHEIANRLKGPSWRYHDQKTIVWKRDDLGTLISQRTVVGLHTVWTGPLFFERDGQTATLRYRASQIAERALGFSNMRVELPRESQRALQGVIAGVPADKGLYVEVLPGRIYELPSALCSSDESDPILLDRLAWDTFGTGDKITLRRAPALADRHGQEGVLISWKHGVRNAIGPAGALMPRIAVDSAKGSAVFGAGQFRLTIPSSQPENFWELAVVGGDRPLKPAPVFPVNPAPIIELDVKSAAGPKAGDLLFCITNKTGQISAAEYPSWIVVPDRKWVVQSGPLTHDCVYTRRNGRRDFRARRMTEIVRSAGGAFALTVESVLQYEAPKPGLIFVSQKAPRISSGRSNAGGSLPLMPSSGDIIAVVVSSQNRVEAVGIPKSIVLPDKSWKWDSEPLMEGAVIADEKGRMRFDIKRLSECVLAAGGALSFTVEGVARLNSGEPGPIFVSRRIQLQWHNTAEANKLPLEPGTTVLLTTGTAGELQISGLPGWAPKPAPCLDSGEEIDWRADSFFRNVIERDDAGRVRVDNRRIAQRIILVGGALPVTFEYVQFGHKGELGQLFYSRRHQNLTLDDGAVALARVVGFMPEINLVVLAVGGRHLELPALRLVEGAPRELWRDIIDALIRVQADLWVHRIGDGYHIGVQGPTIGNLHVRCVAIISDVGETGECQSREAKGIICVGSIDHRLYWLNAKEVGSTRFTTRQLEIVFPLGGAIFDVVRLPQGGVSVVQHPRLKAEIRRLRPGVTITVRPVLEATADSSTALPQFADMHESKCCLARSTATGLFVSLAFDEDDALEDEATPIPVEIAWRWHDGLAVRVTAVKRGRRPMQSDIPDALLWTPEVPLAPTEDIIYRSAPARAGSMNYVSAPTIDSEDQSERELLDQAGALAAAGVYGLRTALETLLVLAERNRQKRTELDDAFWLLAADVGRRALRSHHLEPLARRHARSLRGEVLEYETQGLHKRIEEILALVRGTSGSVTAGEIADKLEAIILFASLYPQPDDATILVHALSAGVGGRHDLSVLVNGSATIASLVMVTRPFGLRQEAFSGPERNALTQYAMHKFREFLDRLREEDFDIPLPRGFTMSISVQ